MLDTLMIFFCRFFVVIPVVALIVVSGFVSPSWAEITNLTEAWNAAYTTSPVLKSSLETLRATRESVDEALGGWQPIVDGNASIGKTWSNTPRISQIAGSGSKAEQTFTPRILSIQIDQPIFNGFGTTSATAKARAQVNAAQARVFDAEQTLMLDVGTAYADLVYAQEVVDLRANNENVLNRQLAATRECYDVGTVTRTDVSQSESRWQRARADLIQAQGELALQRAIFTRLVGEMPAVVKDQPVGLGEGNLNESQVVDRAERENPLVLAARCDEQAAQSNVGVARASLLPEVKLSGEASRSLSESVFNNGGRTDQASITAQLRLPLYAGGAAWARFRAARYNRVAARYDVTTSQRQAHEEAVSAWQALVTAQGAIQASKAQVTAAELALDGVRQENEVGTRTTLDVLDSEQELLDARVMLRAAHRDESKAILAVRAAIGDLTAASLSLNNAQKAGELS